MQNDQLEKTSDPPPLTTVTNIISTVFHCPFYSPGSIKGVSFVSNKRKLFVLIDFAFHYGLLWQSV